MIDLPKVTLDDNVKVRKNYSLKEVDAEMEKNEIIPKHFDDVQPRPDQAWNCDEVGIDPNRK